MAIATLVLAIFGAHRTFAGVATAVTVDDIATIEDFH